MGLSSINDNVEFAGLLGVWKIYAVWVDGKLYVPKLVGDQIAWEQSNVAV